MALTHRRIVRVLVKQREPLAIAFRLPKFDVEPLLAEESEQKVDLDHRPDKRHGSHRYGTVHELAECEKKRTCAMSHRQRHETVIVCDGHDGFDVSG